MQWNEEKSIFLSRILVVLFAAAILVLDMGSLALSWLQTSPSFHLWALTIDRPQWILLTVCCWLCSGFGYLLLDRMNRLLVNLQKEQIFVSENVRYLRTVSQCCFAACGICLCFSLKMPSLLSVSFASGFVGLIVRIVKNVFEKAIAMKDELDYTV